MNAEEVAKFEEEFKAFFDEKKLVEKARELGWFQRVRDIEVRPLVLSLLSALFSQDIRTLSQCHSHYVMKTEKMVTYQPFYLKLTHPEAPSFFSWLVQELLSKKVQHILQPLHLSKLRMFEDIWIQDGSFLRFQDGLSSAYPSKWKHAPAGCKLHLTYGLFEDKPLSIQISDDCKAEKHFLPDPSSVKGKLLLLDRGYFDQTYVTQILQAGGDIIVRAKKNLNPVLVGIFHNGCLIPQDAMTWKHLRSQCIGKNIDALVRWKKTNTDLRLIGLWNPKTQQHTWLLTTLDSCWTPEEVGVLYRLRWQIELCFKKWKSHANLKTFQTDSLAFAETFLYASLVVSLFWRFCTHTAEYLSNTPLSASRSLSLFGSTFSKLAERLLQNEPLYPTLQFLFSALSRFSSRSHPKRELKKGRMQLGLVHTVQQDVFT